MLLSFDDITIQSYEHSRLIASSFFKKIISMTEEAENLDKNGGEDPQN